MLLFALTWLLTLLSDAEYLGHLRDLRLGSDVCNDDWPSIACKKFKILCAVFGRRRAKDPVFGRRRAEDPVVDKANPRRSPFS